MISVATTIKSKKTYDQVEQWNQGATGAICQLFCISLFSAGGVNVTSNNTIV